MEPTVIIVSVVALATIGAAWALWRSVRRLTVEKEGERRRVNELTVENATLKLRCETLETIAATDRAKMEELQAAFRAEFRNLAGDILEEKSRAFRESSSDSLMQLLDPFRVNIKEFRERVEKIYSEENEQRGALKNEIRNLLELNRLITKETADLTSALRGNSKVQGDWGEMILSTILESSGLRQGIHYVVQENIRNEEGRNLRPDVILMLPDEKRVVIDSKVSLTAFVDYVGQDNEPLREAALRDHTASVRRHVDELSGKSYQELLGVASAVDFVIMFIPNEPAFLAAVGADASIWSYAYNKKVIVSSPTNLFALLKMVDDLWKRDQQGRNAIRIAEQAGKMLNKFVGFLETLEEAGRGLDRARTSYDAALRQLREGPGNLIRQGRTLEEMGVKAKKSLPVDNSDELAE